MSLLLFSFIVFFHELGHFLLAKKNGIRVEEFSIGMGPRLWSRVKGETRYSLKIFPIGGSCMMGEDETDDMSEGSFNSKSVWARISVILGGPVFNFILAFLLAMIIVVFSGIDKPVVGSISEGYPAEASGIEVGDRIISLNGKNMYIFRDISAYNQFHQGQEVDVVYEREGEKLSTTLTPKYDEENGIYLFGLGSAPREKGNVLEVIKYGAIEVKYWVGTTIESLKGLITGLFGVDQLSGPVGIVNVVGDSYEESRSYGWLTVLMTLLNWGIILSANLGVMNLLPLPALDGGRLVFLVIEAIRGKRVPPEKEGMVHMIGMMLLFALMIFVMFNDIRNIFA